MSDQYLLSLTYFKEIDRLFTKSFPEVPRMTFNTYSFFSS